MENFFHPKQRKLIIKFLFSQMKIFNRKLWSKFKVKFAQWLIKSLDFINSLKQNDKLYAVAGLKFKKKQCICLPIVDDKITVRSKSLRKMPLSLFRGSWANNMVFS